MIRNLLFLPVLAAAALQVPSAARAQAKEPPAQARAAAGLPSDAEIRRILAQRVDDFHMGVGAAVGIIDPGGRRVITYGRLKKGDSRPLDGRTVFEIGSVTKVFTSLLLADMVQRKEVALTDPVSKYLPPAVKVPGWEGQEITLQDLANQVSGLPVLPANLQPKDPGNPYADYTVEQLYRFLTQYRLTRAIGARYEYSNLGVGLLGHVLCRRLGRDFEALVRERITGPLGMKHTAVALSPDMRARLATGHDSRLDPALNWDLPTLAGAGALRSDVDDMLTFLAANLGFTKSRLAPAMAAMLVPRKPTGATGTEIGLGWHISTRDGVEYVWHNGGTGGYRSFLGYCPSTRTGVVALINAATEKGVDDIGMHLLDPTQPLMAPPKVHQEISLDPSVLDRFVGRYQLAPGYVLNVTKEGGQLYVQATGTTTGQSRFPIFPEAERDFFAKEGDVQFTFQRDALGKASGLLLTQNGRSMEAPRLADDAPPPVVRKVIPVDAAVLEKYVGNYEVNSSFTLVITREDDRLFALAPGQFRYEVFAESPTRFFFKNMDAQIRFIVNQEGKVEGLILRQNGADMPAQRKE